MGYIKRLKDNELVGGISDKYVYPITASSAVYHDGRPMDEVVNEVAMNQIVDNKDVTLEYDTKSTIAKIGDKEITVTMPESTKAVVDDKKDELEFGKNNIIANIDGVDITAKLPNVESVTVNNNAPTLDYDGTYTIGTINNNPLTLKMPAKPTIEIPSIDSIDMDVTSWGSESDYKYWFGTASAPASKTSLLYAVGLSLKYDKATGGRGGNGVHTRIHFKNNINVTTKTQIDTTNCEIDGNGFNLNMNENSLYISAKMFVLNNVRLFRVNDGASPDGLIGDMNRIYVSKSSIFSEKIVYLKFKDVYFFNFPLVTSGSAIAKNFYLIDNTDNDNGETMYIDLIRCKITVRPRRLSNDVVEYSYNGSVGYINVKTLGSINLTIIDMLGGCVETTEKTYSYRKSAQKIAICKSGWDGSDGIVTSDGSLYSDGSSEIQLTNGSQFYENLRGQTKGNLSVWYGMTTKETLKLLNS